MQSVIRLLPESLINQIAAGEVVQRPASAIKELIENSLDAKSSSIELVIKDAGKSLIQIVDNGCGMSQTDARLCFERHATSKIKDLKDLFQILTFGFRGEALASIAAVSQVVLRTKQETDNIGTSVEIHGGNFIKEEAYNCPNGTSITIKNLFYNVPARRNFLKSNPVEVRHIVQEFTNAAISYPNVAFTFINNDTLIYQLKPGTLVERIVQLHEFLKPEQLLPVNEPTNFVKVSGYIGIPEAARKMRGAQYFYVNGRFVRSPLLNHAIVSAYGEMISSDSFPFYAINLEISPERIDINIHPTKIEVKFDDEKTVYSILNSAIKKAIGKYHSVPTQIQPLDAIEKQIYRNHNKGNSNEETLKQFIQNRKFEGKAHGFSEAWRMLYDNNETNTALIDTKESAVSNINHIIANNLLSTPQEIESIVQIFNTYLITEKDNKIVFIDRHAAHERVLYEEYVQKNEKRAAYSQKLLYPQTLFFSPEEFALIREAMQALNKLGFECTEIKAGAVLISGLPNEMRNQEIAPLFQELLETLRMSGIIENVVIEWVARTLSQQNAVVNGKNISNDEALILCKALFRCEQPYFTPRGNPTLFFMEEVEILSRLGKKLT